MMRCPCKPILLLLLLMACASTQAATVYKITFDHGAGSGPADYTAATNEMLPANVHGIALNTSEAGSETSQTTGNLINPDVPGPQGGQALNMTLGGSSPTKQGYYFGRDYVPSGGSYWVHTYMYMGCPDAIGEAGPVISNEFTIEAVVRPDFGRIPTKDLGLTSASYIFDSYRPDGQYGGGGLAVDQNTGLLSYKSGISSFGSFSIDSNTALIAGQWSHVAVVVKKAATARVELWINGALDKVSVLPGGWDARSIFTLPGYFTIGTQYYPVNGRNWQGQIDAVAVSDAALKNGSFVLPMPNSDVKPRAFDFGKQWVRNHPFQIFGWTVRMADYLSKSLSLYTGCGMNAALIPYPTATVVAEAEGKGLSWHGQIFAGALTDDVIAQINAISSPKTNCAWYIIDEPPAEALPGVGQVCAWLKANRPDSLAYMNINGCIPDELINDILGQVKPDVLMIDNYPFVSEGTGYDQYFSILMQFRRKTMERGIPFWSWMQCFTDTVPWRRFPSESELRMQVFSHLAAGCKGLGYFTYDSNDEAKFGGLVKSDLSVIPLYKAVAKINPEVTRLGRCLKFLESVDVRFISGGKDPTPPGLSNWSAASAGDTHILSVNVTPGQTGDYKNGMIGFFTDDIGERYFMVTNLNQHIGVSSAKTALSFSLTFDASVNALLRLNRNTGKQEIIPLTNHVLKVTLPGGTGDLFKYKTGAPFFTGTDKLNTTLGWPL